MRPWYRYTEKTDERRYARMITPFSKEWGYGAPVTLGLIIANVGIWLVMVISIGAGWLDLGEFWFKYFAMTPRMVFEGHVYQVFTAIFLHSQDFLHVLFNMYLLWMFGARVERTFSSRMFLFFYLVCGIVGCLLSLLMRSFGSPDIPSLGASGAVFGVLVAYGFLFANETILLFFAFPVKVWKAVVGFIALETLFILFQMQAGTDNWAHLGGAMASAVWMLVLVRRTGNKTAHGWHHSMQQRSGVQAGQSMQQDGSRRRVILFPGQKKPKKGFWIFKQRKKTGTDQHPEGTDDEPPPDWFKL